MKNVARQWLAALVLLLLIGGGIAFGFYLGGQNRYEPAITPESAEESAATDAETSTENETESATPAYQHLDRYSTVKQGPYGQTQLVPNGRDPERTVGNLTFGSTNPLDTDTFMAPYKDSVMQDGKVYWADQITWAEVKNRYDWFQVGTFDQGPFAGQQLLVLNMECDGPCFYPMLYRFAYDAMTGELTYFENESADWESEELKSLLRNRTGALLPELALPERITIPGTDNVFTRDQTDAMFWGDSGYFQNFKPLFNDSEVGPLFELTAASVGAESGCVYAVAPDGSIVRYAYDPAFGSDNNQVLEQADGKKIYLSEYNLRSGGCGIIGGCYMIENVNMSELMLVGTTGEVGAMYTVKNPDINAATIYENNQDLTRPAGRLADIYRTYSSLNKENAKSFSDFTADHPLLYFQDPLGRWVSLVNSRYQPPAECGKPVIYLYPERPMDVDVRVEVDRFTKTIPEHGIDGWHVKATPSGKLFNYADQKRYPYLFWEAFDSDQIETDRGFSVARQDVPRFLRRSLSELGFTRRETKDFIEFWEPRMLDNPEPYFFVSFLGTREFNKVAPLHIAPAPDTLIRVFMYYEPMNEPMAVLPQELKPARRHGFTVFEWGGTSSRPWADE